MKKNQDDIQVDNQDDIQVDNQDDSQDEKNKNITCNIFKEQFDLINQLPESERANVLYLAVSNAFLKNEKNQLDSQLDSQDERAYISISISISNSIYKSLSSISKSVLNLLYKTINCKTYKSNWGGDRKSKKENKGENPKKTQKPKPEYNPDLIFDKNIKEAFNIYKEECKDLIPLSYEKRDNSTLKILESVLNSLDYDVVKFKDLCKKANRLVKIADTKIDFKMMLRNYIGILQNKYKDDKKDDKEEDWYYHPKYERVAIYDSG